MRPPQPLQTVLVIVVGMIAGYLLSAKPWMLYAALVIGLSGALSPALARCVHTVWMQLGRALGLVVPKILLSLLFYLLLTPLAWLSRWLGPSDPLQLRNTRDSMFRDVNTSFDPGHFEKPW